MRLRTRALIRLNEAGLPDVLTLWAYRLLIAWPASVRLAWDMARLKRHLKHAPRQMGR